MKKILFFFVFISLISFILGCTDNKDFLTNPDRYILSESIMVPLSPIDTKIILKFIEEITSSKRNLILLCFTEKTYSPAGSKIISSITQESDTIKIVFEGLLISDVGAAIFSPASVRFDLDPLHEGAYILDITINGKKLLSLITVTNELFEFKIQPNNIVHFYNEILLRVPETIIWGQAESIEPRPFQIFLDSLVILGAQHHNLKPGDYCYFEVDPYGGFNTHSTLGMAHGEYFLYNFEGDTLTTRNLIKRFAKRYLDLIYIQLSGGRGERFYSTVLMNEP